MLKNLRTLVLAGLAALIVPMAAGGFSGVSDAELAKLEGVSSECTFASQSLLTEGCDGIFLIEFVSDAAQAEFDAERDDELRGSFESLSLSAYELNGQELGLLTRSPAVRRVVENTEFSISTTQADAPWHLDRIDGAAPVAVEGPYSYTYDETAIGAGVTVYIVDTGINSSHVEFTGRTAPGFSSIGTSTDTLDCNGHGTHVAALAAGSVFGAAKGATVVPVRVLDCNGSGTLLGVLQGIDWIAANTLVGQPAVVNMSLGGDRNSVLDAAIANLTSQGLAFVVAAGNSAVDACNVSPAAATGAITVAASGKNDAWGSFSNFGSCVDVIAPGVELRSAWYSSNNGEAVASGTSMAAAVVSGVTAVQMSDGYQRPEALLEALSADAVRGVVTSVPAGTPNHLVQNLTVFDQSNTALGSAYESDTAPVEDVPVVVDPVLPEPPRGGGGGAPAPALPPTYEQPTVSTAGTSATVSWAIPEAATDLVSQVVKLYSGTTEIQSFEVVADVTSLVIAQLAPGVVYRVAVGGVNSAGAGALSVLSEPFEVSEQLLGPEGGEFSAWVKKINDTQIKFYAKYPQLGDKIQFMVQQPNGVYKEIAWLRVEQDRIDENGEYIGLQNNIYFIRTITLREGKNRLRILVNGEQLDPTRTYTL